MHKEIFEKSDAFITEHNMQNNTYTLAHNKFSDMTEEQKARYRGRLPGQTHDGRRLKVLPEVERNGASLDWRSLGAVNPI